MTRLRVIEDAWERVIFDCGCSDMYFCPTSSEVECPRHSGFVTCCDRLDEHVLVPAEIRTASPWPRPLPGWVGDGGRD